MNSTIAKKRTAGSVGRIALLFGAGVALAGALLWIGGCSHSERFGSLIVQTDFAPRTVVTLETMTEAIAFTPVASSSVDERGVVRFSRLPPGEYRLVRPEAAGQERLATNPFGVSRSETTVTFLAAPP